MLKRISGASAFVNDDFSADARALRAEFDRRFADPLATSNARFVWDYWNVPGQYTLVRTPAYHFFSGPLYKRFHESLLAFGRERLGCYDITPPWLSFYVEGCRQELHADVPHGPWAFVYSLTLWNERRFTGGETLILKPATLDYWRHFSELKGVEHEDLAIRIPSRFNRLLVFDPRFPHGVTPVHGVHDPRLARLVIHGWFTDPEPYVTGALTRAQATGAIQDWLASQAALFSSRSDLHGALSARFGVSPAGKVSKIDFLTNTLLSLEGATVKPFLKSLETSLSAMRFPKARGPSKVTLPLVFKV
ncbi:MAG TPA: 2OG-Fe(II) oxygenase [Bdellovibrionales bacterium]|nr:2OG-Fe(II) oxygenase [Bdellovibrionales bacterium]